MEAHHRHQEDLVMVEDHLDQATVDQVGRLVALVDLRQVEWAGRLVDQALVDRRQVEWAGRLAGLLATVDLGGHLLTVDLAVRRLVGRATVLRLGIEWICT